MKWLRKHLAYALAAILVAVGVFAAGGVINGFADETATSAPTVEKTLTPNGDGTYKLSLSVTGTASSESSSSKANVVIVFDTSGSMNNYATGGTRMSVAKSATKDLIHQLLANNTEDNRDLVEIALVPFSTTVGTTTPFTTSESVLTNAVDSYRSDGGTNWQDALKTAKSTADDKAAKQPGEATYVIFVSDGNPTFRNDRYDPQARDYNDSYYYYYKIWGTGRDIDYPEGSINYNYDAAKGEADQIINAGYTMYAIGAFGNAGNMQSIGGKYYRADDSAALTAAFADILNQITNAVGFKNVSMTDNVTGLTASTLVDGQASGFTYTKDGQPWTGAPAASFEGGKVSWDLTSAGTLEKGAKYTVSFDVWPSQKSLDLLADLNNGTKKYDDLTAEEKAQIVAVDGGGYGLNTNTDSGNSVAYTQVETKTVNKGSLKEDGYTWVDNGDGTWTGTKETAGTPINFTNPKPMPLTSSPMTIQKVFENSLDDTSADSINLMVKSDGNDYLSETLTSAESWTKTLSIAPGIIKGKEVLEGGHDYTVTEPGDYHWDLTAPVYHPMIIDGKLTMLQEDANGSYAIANKKYSAIEGTTLTATNSRRSVINLTKVVDDKTNGSAPTDAAFTYTGTVTDPDHADVWFSVMDAQGNLVKELTTSATAEEKDGAKTGYYYVASGTEFTVDLQADQNLRIVNAPKGMTYSFTESTDMPKGFAFEKAEGDDLPDQTVSGTVTASNTKYAAKFTNSYDKVTLVSGTEDGLKATKAVTGHDATEAFNFDLSAADNATKADVESGDIVMAGTTATTSDAMKDGATKTVNFGDVTFYAEGTYKFTIDETTTTKAGGWTYDAATHDVTVKVTKVDGKLVATVADNNPTFTNEYKADTTIETKAEGNAFLTKTVTADGTAWAPKTFEFQISAAEGTPMPEKATGSATFDAAGSQVIDFGKITYTKPGTYTYTVKETTTGENDGWTYDNAEKTVSVNVVDNNDGTLTAKVSGVTITNVYGANGKLDSAATAVLTKTVVADGTAWAPKTFEFKVTPEGGAPAPEKTTGSATFSAAGSQTVSFGEFKFTKAGTYKYKVQETTASGEGWECDNAEHEAIITVKDNGDGTLTATVTTPAAITNEYKPSTTIDSKAEGSAFLTKTVVADGTAWAPKTFDFQISAPEGTPMPASTTGSATFSEAGTKAVDFGTVTYTKAGTYTYTVTETTADGSGWDCDNEPKTVTVTVTDKGDGTLTATVTGATITNEYKPTTTIDTDAEASTFLTKTVVADGTAWADKTFDFTITAPEGTPMPSKTAGSATFSEAGAKAVDFGTVTYTKAGTYTYTVTETTADGSGWDCDNEPKTVTVTVTDKGDGTLVATVAGASITNTYSTTGTLDSSATAVLTKTVVADGTAWAPKTFEFSITQAEGSPAPESATGSATFSAAGTQVVSFGKFNFTKAGTYTYTVKETTESGAGWTCDNAEHEVVITVKDNGNGTLTAAVTTPASITNTYGDFQPLTVADPPVSKVVEGDPAVMPTFEFTMTGAEGAPMPEGSANGAKTVALQGAGSVEFGDITFTKPGTYTYTVAETKGGADGWTNDTQTYTVVYTVTDNGDGTMSAAMTVNGAADGKAIFTNSYAAKGELDTTATAVLTKTVESKVDDTAWAPKTFDFTITPAKGNPADVTIENAKGSATFQAAGTQTISFGKIAFTKAGTYNFSVAETTQSGNGWTCDTTAKNVEVKVTDKGDGTLVAAVKAPADIKNVYDVKPIEGDDAVKLSVTKTLEGNTLAAGQFSFELKDAQGNLLQTKSNAADGTVAFDGLVYTKPGTYEYTISEVNDEKAGYKYDGDSATVTVTVTDKGDGTMSAEAKYGKTTFSNSYAASGNTGTTIFAQKTLEGRQLADGQFKFELKDSDDNVLQTKTNDASGRVVFDAIEYDQSIFGEAAPETDEPKAEEPTTEPAAEEPKADEPKAEEPAAEPEAPKAEEPAAEPEAAKVEGTDTEAETTEVANPVAELTDALASLISTTANAADNPRTKVFTYKISEVNDGKDGYEYDGHVETVTVTVTDKGDGTLAVSTAYDEDGATFANKYTATGETGSSVTATKTLTGRDMVEGEFEFALLDAAGNEVATGKNAADGSVTFSSIKYTQDEVGEHEYTMVEKSGSKTGVTYDTAKKPVKVTVTDNGNGTLATAVSYPEGNTFENTYKPLATSGYLTAQKVLNGRELQAGEFSFELLDADGNVIDTQSNAADGTVKFEGLNFDEAGTFTYQVREVKGDEANVTYDEKVATYTVVVEDVDGQLTITSVTADGSDQAAVFTNTYTEPPAPTPEPEQPRRPLPNSGDATPDATPLAMIGLAVLAGGVLLRKRELGK